MPPPNCASISMARTTLPGQLERIRNTLNNREEDREEVVKLKNTKDTEKISKQKLKTKAI